MQLAVPAHHGSFDWAEAQAKPSVAYPGAKKYADPWRIKLPWLNYFYEVNKLMGTLKGFREWLQVWSGGINAAANPEYKPGSYVPYKDPSTKLPKGFVFPRVELIVTVGNDKFPNPLKVVERKRNAVQFEVFNYMAKPPDVNKVNPRTHRWKFDELHSLDRNRNVGLAPKGLRFWFPRIAKGGIARLPLSVLEPITWPPKKEVVITRKPEPSRQAAQLKRLARKLFGEVKRWLQ